jgi:DNA-binding response OmpR family regulator
VQKGIILSVDDDNNLQTVLEQYLQDDGYKVVTAGNIASALEKATATEFDVILLDLVLPDGEGMSLIPQIRAKSQAAIIVVSGKSETTEKIVCLEMGADDYMTKPFEMRELSARIKAVLRRSNDNEHPAAPSKAPSKAEKINFAGWCLDRTQYQLFDADRNSADLTTGEFKLLEALVLAPNRALSRQQLFDLTRTEGGEYGAFDRAIDIQIARLRKKLDDDGSMIKTIRGVGYMFTAETSES